MRDLLIVIAAAAIAILAGTAIYIYAPRSTDVAQSGPDGTQSAPAQMQAPGTPVSITVLKQGTDAPQDMGRGNYRIKDAGQLATLWKLLFGAGGPTPPGIDFKTQEVLAVFDGTHATGGYTVSIDEVADGTVRTAVVTHTAPGSDCMVSQGFTAPYEVIAVPKTMLSLSHIDNTATAPCK